MHTVIENARKAAGISSMKKNYPDDPKQRGCGFWAAFVGAVANDLGRMDRDAIDSSKQIAELARKNAELEHDLNKLRTDKAREVVGAFALEKGLPVDERQNLQKRIAG